MRTILLGILCLLAMTTTVNANQWTEIYEDNACKLFDALNIEQIDLSQDIHKVTILEKTMPGLDCLFNLNQLNTVPSVSCGCLFSKDLSQNDMAGIYSAINIGEEIIDSGYPKVYQKKVGTLSFIKRFYNPDHYEFYTEYEFDFLNK
jgi:hypothetical protein